MKVRSGFVSNSSSSSFICDVTGEEVQGMDLGIEEAGMYCCEEEHYFNEEFLVETSHDIDELDNDRYGIPKENCPICSFVHIMEDQMVIYLKASYNIEDNEVYSHMKKKIKD